ncbi:MAG: NYN domain-containing protein [Chloroflexota bacterium]|nr:NYN domain-containing protein [Chloroflexota bacterium]
MSQNREVIAVLIDGDNVIMDRVPTILSEVAKYGEITIAKVFLNKTSIEKWETFAAKYPVDPIWVPNNIKGKNSVDIALVIDAMIIACERADITGFCIAASDSDYARLAKRLKSKRKFVLGIGEAKTPDAFRTACSEFIEIGDLMLAPPPVVPLQPTPRTSTAVAKVSTDPVYELFIRAYTACRKGNAAIDEDWMQLRVIRDKMTSLDPAFSLDELHQPRKLAEKLQTLNGAGIIEIREIDGKHVTHEVRLLYFHQIEKFFDAFAYAADTLKFKDAQGWVLLALIGETLTKMFPEYNPLLYHGIKQRQLKKVVEKIILDYPGIMELEDSTQHPRIKMKMPS